MPYKKANSIPTKTRRIITVCVGILLMILAAALIVNGVRKSHSNSDKNANAGVSAKTSQMIETKTKEKTTEEETTEDEAESSSSSTTEKTSGAVTTTSAKKGLFNPTEAYKANHTYCVAVNTQQNIVTVYSKDSNGDYTKPVRAFASSCGKAESKTKTGVFYTSTKWRWESLYGGVYGQYVTRIDGPYLFHSVPYTANGDPSSLEYDEYNKLGSPASLGCVRLCVRDAKWIYDNLESGTMVYLYESSSKEPLAKPSSIRIDTSSPNRGWDPTDPDPNNPWNA